MPHFDGFVPHFDGFMPHFIKREKLEIQALRPCQGVPQIGHISPRLDQLRIIENATTRDQIYT